MVLLDDHLHVILTLPEGDTRYRRVGGMDQKAWVMNTTVYITNPNHLINHG
jgi:REP element-mobilizing transposase RayT